VSILDLDRLRGVLEIPSDLVPVAYLCVGYVSEFPAGPELESAGWENRESLAKLIHLERWTGGAGAFACPKPAGRRKRLYPTNKEESR
jgi:5,6-dimethylbenzimidazole synthase